MVSPTGRLAADHPELLTASGGAAATRPPSEPAAGTASPADRPPAGGPAKRPDSDWDRVIASVEPEEQGRRGSYVEEPTEVIGPFDVGQWTVQGKTDGPPERARSRATPAKSGGADRPPGRPTPSGPGSTPSGPAPKPSGPASKPSGPGSKPNAPASKSSGPAPKPSGPAPKPNAPAPKPNAPAPKPSAPASKPSGPAKERPPDRDDARLAAVVAAARRGPGRPGAGRPAGNHVKELDGPTRGDRVRTVVSGLAQLLITLGVVLLLFAAYEVWFTGVLNHRAQDRLKSELDRRWEAGEDPIGAGPVRPDSKVRSIPMGEGFALIYIPDFGTDYVYTVVEGTGTAQLDEGPGHYPDSALPGEVGNFALAGHRVGKGSPFLNLDKLKVGSAIVIRTRTYWYTYRVLGDAPTGNPRTTGPLGVPGIQVVEPNEVGVVAPVPNRVGVAPTQRLLTLTTCHPKFSARQRLVIHAQLDGSPLPTGAGLPPALASGGG